MGQRLNIEIKKQEKLLANCYYHWSGYSEASLLYGNKISEMLCGSEIVKLLEILKGEK